MENNIAYGARVRLRYATLVNILSRISSVFASLFFTISVTRRLSVEEFGIWTMIFKYVGYVTPFIIVYTYWLPRTISRGVNTAKTGLAMAASIGLFASIAYVGVAFGASFFFNQPLVPLLIASFIVFQEYVNRCLIHISIAHKPQYSGISEFVLKTTQALSAVLLVLFYKLGILGAVFAVIIGRLSSIILLYLVNAEIISKSNISLATIRKWIKQSWLPLYSSFAVRISAFDVLIVRIFAGSEEPIAYYGVSLSTLGLLAVPTRVMPALYARLLAKRDIRDVVEVFWIAYMLLIPMVMGIILYAEPIIAVYSINYVPASWTLRIFALSALIRGLSTILSTTLKGLETRDYMYKNVKLRKTILFKIPVVRTITSIVYLASLSLASCILQYNYVLLSNAWGIAYLINFALLVLAYNTMLKKEFSVSLPYRVLLKYVGTFVAASIAIVLIRFIMPVKPYIRVWDLLEHLTPAILASTLAYFATLYIISSKFREFTRACARYLKGVKEKYFTIFFS